MIATVILSELLRHKPLKQLALLLSLILLPAVAVAGTLSIIGSNRWVQAAYIYDGDTFRTSKGERIRLLGINTPEVGHNRQRPQPFSKEASKRLKQLIAGKVVQLSFDKERRDIYGRTLAQLYLRDGRWINKILVREGLAQLYVFEPNHRWSRALLAAEQQARAEKLGLWSSKRFKIVAATNIRNRHIGQFRLVTGTIKQAKKWGFKLARLHISIPHKYRSFFKHPPTLKAGQPVTVRGVIRTSPAGDYFLALHSPFDIEVRR
ncbi:MAG: thermonuclease family protein [Mariprofundus sp.]|nr:thermonuclease family protein [Mariprofundus sp.]